MRKKFQGSIKSVFILLVFVGMGSRSMAMPATFGFTNNIDITMIPFFSTTPIILVDNNVVKGFAELAGGFHTATDSSITFSNVMAPIAKDIYLRSGTHLNFEGDLTLSTSSIEAGGSFMINAGGNTLFLEKDTTLPGQPITLTTDLIIDGQGHVVTFKSATIFNLNGHSLRLKNMIISGLTGTQFTGLFSLALQNCIIDIPSGTTVVSTDSNADLYIYDDVVIRGGGTFKFGNGANSALIINAFSTLYIDQDTTLDYASTVAGVNMDIGAVNAPTIHINGGSLKVDSSVATSGLILTLGRLFLEGKCTLNNMTNTDVSKSIQFGNGGSPNDLTVKILPGARVQVDGYVWHNPSAT